MNVRKFTICLLVGMFTVCLLLEAASRGNKASEAYINRRKERGRGVTLQKKVETVKPVEAEEEAPPAPTKKKGKQAKAPKKAPEPAPAPIVEVDNSDAETVADKPVHEITEDTAPAGISDEDAATRDKNQAPSARAPKVDLKGVVTSDRIAPPPTTVRRR